MSAMLRGLVVLALLLAARPARADENPSLMQKAAIYAKASVVRVLGFWEVTFRIEAGKSHKEYVGGMGSGFFASSDGFVVTNAHVVEEIKLGERRAKEKALGQLFAKLAKQFPAEFGRMSETDKLELAQRLLATATVTQNNNVVLPDGTKLKYQVVAYGKPGEGTDVAVIKTDAKDAPNLTVGDSDRVQIQDKVLAIGYPGAADMQGLLDDKSQLEASINDGAVSAMKRTPQGDPIIQITASITHGNSGGPCINEKGEVIGLSTFGSRGEVQGFNFIVASATVKRFMKEANVNNEPSPTIKKWRAALEEMWAGDLDQAIADFDEVLVLYPQHSEAGKTIKTARQLKKEGKGKPKNAAGGPGGEGGGNAGIAIAVVLGLIVVGGIVFVVLKGKKKGPVPPGMPHPQHAMPHPPGMPPPGMAHPQHAMPHQPPPQPSPYAPPQPGPMMVGGRVGPPPVAKTVAIGQQQHAPVMATAFGSMTLASLTCTRGLLNGQRFALTPQGLLIGRQPGVAQIVVNDSRASGKHVWIGYENGTLVAIDQGTTNGTFINDVRHGRISKAPLKDGDTVIVGEPDCLSLTLKLS
jgi:S1-C subfamily serine protease